MYYVNFFLLVPENHFCEISPERLIVFVLVLHSKSTKFHLVSNPGECDFQGFSWIMNLKAVILLEYVLPLPKFDYVSNNKTNLKHVSVSSI